MPTLMEVVGIAEPKVVNGHIQKPIEGVSMAYTFFEENAEAPSTRTQQYFEMLGNRALYHDGWIASCRHGRLPWENVGAPFSEDIWELYHIAEDFSQAVDLAEQEPEKLLDLRLRFIGDAEKYNVLPLDDRMAERFDVTLRPSFFAGRDTVTLYPGMIRLPEGSAPKTVSIEHTITARVTVPEENAEGVIVSLGGEAAGWSLMLWEGKARYHYNFFGLERYDLLSEPLAAGDHVLRVEFTPDSPAPGVPATAMLLVDGEQVDEIRIKRQVPNRCGTESLDVGMDCVSAVCHDYAGMRGKDGLFPFTGEIESVTLHLGDGPEVTGMDLLRMSVKMD
jgi:arylsulfatase